MHYLKNLYAVKLINIFVTGIFYVLTNPFLSKVKKIFSSKTWKIELITMMNLK